MKRDFRKNGTKGMAAVLAFVMAVGFLPSVRYEAKAAATSGIVEHGKRKLINEKRPVTVFIGGKKVDLDLIVNRRNRTKKVVWKTMDASVVKIDKHGRLTPKKNGYALITGKYKRKKLKALVKVRTRAASMSITDLMTGSEVSEVTMVPGETKTLKIAYGLSEKTKRAGGIASTYNSYARTGDASVASASKTGGGSDTITLTAMKPGETTLEVVANQTSEAMAKGKYGIVRTIKVIVSKPYSVKQSGARKITVNGRNLSGKSADYSVMMGAIPRNVSTVAVNQLGTEAILTMDYDLLQGTYTVSHAGNSATITCEASRLAKFDVPNKYLVLKGNYPSSEGTIEFKAYNQFGEDVTKSVGAVTANTTIGTATVSAYEGLIKVSNIPPTLAVNTPVSVTLIKTDVIPPVTANFTVTIGQKSVASSVVFKGIYNSATKLPHTLTVNSADENAKARLLVSVNDQYGRKMNSTEGIVLNVSPGLTGLGIENKVHTELMVVDGVSYVSLPFTGTAAVKEGKATILAIALYGAAGKNTSQYEVSVSGARQVTDFQVTAPAQVFAGEKTYFDFRATNSNGQLVTDFATLSNQVYGVKLPEAFYFENSANGVAKLVYDAKKDPVIKGIAWSAGLGVMPTNAIFTVAANHKPSFISFNVLPPAQPAAIKSFRLEGVLAGETTENALSKVKILDNRGREMSPSAFGQYYIGLYGASPEFKIGHKNGVFGKANGKVLLFRLGSLDGASLNLTAPQTIPNDYITGNFTFALYRDDSGNTLIPGSEVAVKVAAASIGKLNNYEIRIPELLFSGRANDVSQVNETQTGNAGYNNVKVRVVGRTPGGDEVKIKDHHFYLYDDLGISDNEKKILTPSKIAYRATREGKVTGNLSVVVNDGSGHRTAKVVSISSEYPLVKNAKVARDYVSAGELNKDAVREFLRTLSVTDQYTNADAGVSPGGEFHISKLERINVVSKSRNDIRVDWNNSRILRVSGAKSGDYMTVEITFFGGIMTRYSYKVN